MATVDESNLCSTCNKPSARRFCIGCKKYFCPKHIKEHEQQLAINFDNEIVRTHDELLDRIQKLTQPNHLALDLFAQIEQWKSMTIKKVELAAERARKQLNDLIKEKRTMVTKELDLLTKEIRSRREEENFVENDIDRLRSQINIVQENVEQLIRKDTRTSMIICTDKVDWNRMIYIRNDEQQDEAVLLSVIPLRNPNPKWLQNGITIAGGNGEGSGMNQLHAPYHLFIDQNQTLYVSEYMNHRVMEWKPGELTGRVVAGGNGPGNRLDQLYYPAGVIMDKSRNSLIICDYVSNRLVRWPLQGGNTGEIIISNVGCWSLKMSLDGFIYVASFSKHTVRRYKIGERQGIVVAGGKGQGDRLDQLNHPRDLFVDRDNSIYIADSENHRVVKWVAGANQGIVVAGGQGPGNSLRHLSYPFGIVVDEWGSIYVADSGNHRVMRWSECAEQGIVIIGGNGPGSEPNQLNNPLGLSLDRNGSLYVCDSGNFRIQKFAINPSQ